ncbi:MAG: hypothetical protein QOD93_5199 [Acetobacteraceae bacterium]|jgi:hypothetical protein|nr:hypothetical protein [Acetobacteraceae bacterium]
MKAGVVLDRHRAAREAALSAKVSSVWMRSIADNAFFLFTRPPAVKRPLLNLRANRLVILGSNHCKCLLNQQLLSDPMTTAQRLSQKTRERSKFSILTGEGRASLHGD